ncbi:MAG: protein kinase [Planctomycetota bacterium]
MTSDSWRSQFESEKEFQRLDRQAQKHDFLGVPEFDDRHGSATEENPPTVVGYTIEAQIGEGGTSNVYSAVNKSSGQRVAIKVLHSFGNQSFGLRFRRELDALSRLDHPGIVALIDSGTTLENQPFLVMELIQGIRIDEFCRAYELSIGQRLEVFEQVCEAIGYAHKCGILHRDLKPGNVLVDSGRVKVTDFGLAKLLNNADSNATQQTRTGALMGTLNYLSPEQLQVGNTSIRETTDVFGLGAILYVLLVGRAPFQFNNVVDALAGYYDQFPVRLQSDSGIPADLEAICIKCLSPHPQDRYSDVRAIQEDLNRFQSGKLVLAKRQLFRRRLQIFRRQYPWFVRLFSLGVLSVVVAAFAFLLLWQQSKRNFEIANQMATESKSTLNKISATVREVEQDPATLGLQRRLLTIIADSYENHSNSNLAEGHFFALAQTQFKLGQVHHHSSEFEDKEQRYIQALRNFEYVLENEPQNEAAKFGKFHTLFALTRYEQSNEVITELLKNSPENKDYRDAKITNLHTLARSAISDLDFEKAASYRDLTNQWEYRAEPPSTNDIRRACRSNFIAAKLAVVEGELKEARRLMQSVIERYQEMQLTNFRTADHCGELFYYLRFAMSLSTFANDLEASQNVLDVSSTLYSEAHVQYSGFTHYRFWYLLMLMEVGNWLANHGHHERIGPVSKSIQQGLSDWKSSAKVNDDYFAAAYLYGMCSWATTEEKSDYLHEIRKRMDSREWGKVPNTVLFGLIRDQNCSNKVEFLRNFLSGKPESIRARWYLSHLAKFPKAYQYFLAENLSCQDKLKILAHTGSYFETTLDKTEF